MKTIAPVILMMFLAIHAFSQEKVIRGKVTVFEEMPLSGVEIVVKSSGNSSFSDSLGLFRIECQSTDKLQFKAHGFHRQNVRVKEKSKYVLVDLKLLPGEENRELAVGYGYVKDKDKLYAISARHNNEIDYSRYPNIMEALTGNFPGLQIQNGEIVIRDSPSFTGNNSALLILDGREVTLTSLKNINLKDIARISVLKDASSAIYGSRGGNGVVIVETKRGGSED